MSQHLHDEREGSFNLPTTRASLSSSIYPLSPPPSCPSTPFRNLPAGNGSLQEEAHLWSGPIRADGRWFKDDHNRTCLLRGVNLGGNAKLPMDVRACTPGTDEFFKHTEVSFAGRPLPLEEADVHFRRLRLWGLTFIRLIVTWESLEHAGPGVYDEEHISYLVALIERMAHHGLKCFIDPHQDVWSRFSGGSGAPGWTFEVAGMNMRNFTIAGAAHLHDPSGPADMLWPTNYTKLASCTMFTLFWAGDTFAPKRMYGDHSVQRFLQDRFIACYAHLAERLKHLESVVGFEVMNEPHQGYIGLEDFHRFDSVVNLVFGDAPSAIQSFALGEGIPQLVDVYVRSWPYPTRRKSRRWINTEKLSAWLPNRGGCVWREHGVWDIDKDGRPVVLKPQYFRENPKTGEKIDFYQDFYMPFVNRYTKAVQEVLPSAFIFLEPLPNDFPPKLSPENDHDNVIYAPHWYDLKALFSKSFDGWVTHDVQGLARGMNVFSATYFGISGAKKNYSHQVSNIVRYGLQCIGERPCVVGECGIPMNINNKQAFTSGDYTHQTNFLDAVITAMERNMVHFTLWNYNPVNDNERGDHWAGEDFSIYTLSHSTTTPKSLSPGDSDGEILKAKCVATTSGLMTPPGSSLLEAASMLVENQLKSEEDHDTIHVGGRALDAIIRPYAAKIAGMPLCSEFNRQTGVYTLQFSTTKDDAQLDEDPVSTITEIFIPKYQYPDGVHVEVSDGTWEYLRERQTLYYQHSPTRQLHRVRIGRTPASTDAKGLGGSFVLAFLCLTAAFFALHYG
ncbi:uncharacterized protein VTP21DRAFT_2290 [Calcarisporiella thermophila]|uniref:uncharacterized protein n=1 Tax=Calcarisporiella thermophila TaxID=911321 RepID=UPI0037438F22